MILRCMVMVGLVVGACDIVAMKKNNKLQSNADRSSYWRSGANQVHGAVLQDMSNNQQVAKKHVSLEPKKQVRAQDDAQQKESLSQHVQSKKSQQVSVKPNKEASLLKETLIKQAQSKQVAEQAKVLCQRDDDIKADLPWLIRLKGRVQHTTKRRLQCSHPYGPELELGYADLIQDLLLFKTQCQLLEKNDLTVIAEKMKNDAMVDTVIPVLENMVGFIRNQAIDLKDRADDMADNLLCYRSISSQLYTMEMDMRSSSDALGKIIDDLA